MREYTMRWTTPPIYDCSILQLYIIITAWNNIKIKGNQCISQSVFCEETKYVKVIHINSHKVSVTLKLRSSKIKR